MKKTKEDTKKTTNKDNTAKTGSKRRGDDRPEFNKLAAALLVIRFMIACYCFGVYLGEKTLLDLTFLPKWKGMYVFAGILLFSHNPLLPFRNLPDWNAQALKVRVPADPRLCGESEADERGFPGTGPFKIAGRARTFALRAGDRRVVCALFYKGFRTVRDVSGDHGLFCGRYDLRQYFLPV